MVQASETLRRISQEIKPDDIHQAWVGGERHDVLGFQSLGRAGSLGDCGLQGQQDAEEKN